MSTPMTNGCLCCKCHKWHDTVIGIGTRKYVCPDCYKKMRENRK